MANTRRLVVEIVGDAKGASAAFAEVGLAGDKFQNKLEKLGASMGKMGKELTSKVTLPIVAGFTFAAVEAAKEDKAIAVLSGTIKKNTGATNDQVAAVEKWITKTQNATGVMDDKLRPAFGNLVIAGRSVTESQHDLGVALDIAAAKGLDVEVVTKAMAKAANGNTGALGRLGVKTKDATGKALSYEEALKKASETMGGSASRAADTAAGRFNILKAKLADMAENIGRIVLPAFESVAGWVGDIAEKFSNLPGWLQKSTVLFLAFVAAVGPLLTLASKLVAIFTLLSENPIILVITGLAIAFSLAYNKIKPFHDAVNAFFGMLGGIGKTAIAFIKADFQILGALFTGVWDVMKRVGSFISAFASGDWAKAWQALKDLATFHFGSLRDFLADNADKILGVVSKMLGFLRHIPGVGQAFKTAQEGINTYRDSLRGANDQADRSGSAFASASGSFSGAVSALASGTGQINTTGKAFKDAADATAELNKEMDANAQKLHALVDPLYASEQATLAYDQGNRSLDEILAKNNKEHVDAATALQNLQGPMLAQIGNIYDMSEKMQKNHQIGSSVLDLRAEEIRRLTELKNKTGDATGEIQAHITKLSELDKKGPINTTIGVNLDEAQRKIDNFVAGIKQSISTVLNGVLNPGKHARGGIAQGLSLVGERGPELLDISNSQRVITADETRSILGGASGGGNTTIINLTVDGSVIAERDLGRYMTNVLDSYQARNGR